MKAYKYAVGLGILYRYNGLTDAGEFWFAPVSKWLPSFGNISVADCVAKLNWPALTQKQAAARFPEAFHNKRKLITV